MKGMWSERNVNETRLSSLSLASPRIPASARPSHPHPYPPHTHPFPTTHHPFTRRSGAVGEVKGG